MLVATMDSVEYPDCDGAGTPGRDAREFPPRQRNGHDRAACTSARRFTSGVSGSIEQPGARRKRLPPVSMIARSASLTTSVGDPAVMVDSCDTPPMTARPESDATSVSDGFVGEWDAQWKTAAG